MADDKTLNIVIRLKDSFSKNMRTLTGGLRSFSDRLLSIKSLIVGGAAGALGKSVLDITSKFEQWGVAFETLTGSTEKANKLLLDLKNLAKTTPFQLPGLIESTKRLLAMGIETEKVIETTRMLGDITAGVGTEKMPQLILAFGQVKTAGRLMGQELRQFNEAGVDLLGAIAENLGKTKQEVKEMVSAGEIGFPLVEKALMSLTDEGGRFFNLMAKQSKTFGGIVSNIQDNLTMMALSIGESLLPNMKILASRVKDFTGERSNVVKITNRIIDFANIIRGIPITFREITQSITSLTDWIDVKFTQAALFIQKNFITKTVKGFEKFFRFFGINTDELVEDVKRFEKEEENATRRILAVKANSLKERQMLDDDWVKYHENSIQKITETETDAIQLLNDGYDSHVNLFNKQNQEKTSIVTKNAKKQAKKELEVYRLFARDIMSESETFGQDVTSFINGLTDALISGPDGLIRGMEKSLNDTFPKEISAFLATTTGSAVAGFVEHMVVSIFGNQPTVSVAKVAERQFDKMVENTNRALSDIGREKGIFERQADLIRNLQGLFGPDSVLSDIANRLPAGVRALLPSDGNKTLSQLLEDTLLKSSQENTKVIESQQKTLEDTNRDIQDLNTLLEYITRPGGIGARALTSETELREQIRNAGFGSTASGRGRDLFQMIDEAANIPGRGDLARGDIARAIEGIISGRGDFATDIQEQLLSLSEQSFMFAQDQLEVTQESIDREERANQIREREAREAAEAAERAADKETTYREKLEDIETSRQRAITDLETEYQRDLSDLESRGLGADEYTRRLNSLNLERQRDLEDINRRFDRRVSDIEPPSNSYTGNLQSNNRQVSNLNESAGRNFAISGSTSPGNNQSDMMVILEADGINLAQGVVSAYNRGITQRRVTKLKGTV